MSEHDQGKEWMKIDLHIFSDGKIGELIAEHGGIIIAYWLGMIHLAKCSSTFGTFTTRARAFERLIGAERSDGMFQAFAEIKLIELVEDDGEITITIPNFSEWQRPRALSGAERTREWRARRSDGDEARRSVTLCDARDGRQDKTRQDSKKENIQKKEEPEPSSSSESSTRDLPVKEVFNHWKSETWSGKGKEPILTTARRNRIKARLKEGFSSDDLKQAISGLSADPFYRGDNDRGTAFLGIETLLRDAGQVEKGIAKLAAGSTKPTVVLDSGMYREGIEG